MNAAMTSEAAALEQIANRAGLNLILYDKIRDIAAVRCMTAGFGYGGDLLPLAEGVAAKALPAVGEAAWSYFDRRARAELAKSGAKRVDVYLDELGLDVEVLTDVGHVVKTDGAVTEIGGRAVVKLGGRPVAVVRLRG